MVEIVRLKELVCKVVGRYIAKDQKPNRLAQHIRCLLINDPEKYPRKYLLNELGTVGIRDLCDDDDYGHQQVCCANIPTPKRYLRSRVKEQNIQNSY